MKFIRLIVVLGLATMSDCHTGAQTEEAPPIANYSFDTTRAVKQLMGTWLSFAIDDSLPIESRKNLVRSLYALLFESWLVTEYQHKPCFVAPNGVKNIINLAKRYADVNDPMSLNSYYDGDTLSYVGKERLESFPMNFDAETFKSKPAYHALIAQFLAWTKQLK